MHQINDKTHKSYILILVCVIITNMIISSCSQFKMNNAQAKHDTNSINLIEKDNLQNIRQIDIYIEGELRANIDDQKVINELVRTLDSEYELVPRITCPVYYQLSFTLQDGSQHEFGLACGPQDPSFLRGEQAYWENNDIRVPFEFARLLQAQLE